MTNQVKRITQEIARVYGAEDQTFRFAFLDIKTAERFTGGEFQQTTIGKASIYLADTWRYDTERTLVECMWALLHEDTIAESSSVREYCSRKYDNLHINGNGEFEIDVRTPTPRGGFIQKRRQFTIMPSFNEIYSALIKLPESELKELNVRERQQLIDMLKGNLDNHRKGKPSSP